MTKDADEGPLLLIAALAKAYVEPGRDARELERIRSSLRFAIARAENHHGISLPVKGVYSREAA